jgi:von Willebrand factor type A domain
VQGIRQPAESRRLPAPAEQESVQRGHRLTFWNIVIAIGAFLLQLILMPKPQNAKPASLDDFDAPTAEEGIEIPILFGTSVLKAPNVTWYGHLGVEAIKGDRRYGLAGPRQTKGYRYRLGVHMCLCHGPADALTEITIGDKLAWQGRSAGGPITINKSGLFGGDDREGGIGGTLDLEMGAPTQGQNSYLASVLGAAKLPAFRGVVGVVLRHMYLGTTPYIKPWAFKLQRVFKRQGNVAQWYPEKAGIGRAVKDIAIYFALDVSGSMFGTRIATLRAAVAATLQDIRSADAGGIDIRMVAWSSTVISAIERRNLNTAGWDDLIAYINGLGALSVGGTSFVAAVSQAAAFFEGSGAKRRILVFATDGGTSPENAAEAAATLAGIANLETYAFNIEWPDTAQTGLLDNTPTDGVPVVPGDNPDVMRDAISSIFVYDVDMNPAHIIRECLTEPWGLAYPATDIDDVSFTAAADRFHQEKFGLSFAWTREEAVEEFVRMVLGHVDAYLYVSRETGKWVLKPIRDDYDIDTIPVVSEDDVWSWDEVVRRSAAEAVNSVIVRYDDRETGADASRAVHNTARIQQSGAAVSTTRHYPGIRQATLAVRAATRDLKALGAGMISGRVAAKRTVEGFSPGDAFRLYSARHRLNGEVMRVTDLRFGDGRDNSISVKFAQDVFALGDDVLVVAPPPEWQDPSAAPAPVELRLVHEMPWRELKQMVGGVQADALLDGDPDAGMLQVAGGAPADSAIHAVISIDAGDGYTDAGVMDFCRRT